MLYPNVRAPVTGIMVVTTQCADNAHIRSDSSLSVMCEHDGRWSGLRPQCQCDSGYTSVSINGKEFCQGFAFSTVLCCVLHVRISLNFMIFNTLSV